jgi:hypothetical protein
VTLRTSAPFQGGIMVAATQRVAALMVANRSICHSVALVVLIN